MHVKYVQDSESAENRCRLSASKIQQWPAAHIVSFRKSPEVKAGDHEDETVPLEGAKKLRGCNMYGWSELSRAWEI